MSEIANKIELMLKELFPYNIILKEHYINYKGIRLFFDYFVKDLGVLVEVQGRQHFEFVEHFHGSMEGFLEQKKRDNLKLEYIEEQGKLCLVRFNYDEDITSEIILNQIVKALSSEEGYI